MKPLRINSLLDYSAILLQSRGHILPVYNVAIALYVMSEWFEKPAEHLRRQWQAIHDLSAKPDDVDLMLRAAIGMWEEEVRTYNLHPTLLAPTVPHVVGHREADDEKWAEDIITYANSLMTTRISTEEPQRAPQPLRDALMVLVTLDMIEFSKGEMKANPEYVKSAAYQAAFSSPFDGIFIYQTARVIYDTLTMSEEIFEILYRKK